MSSLSPRQLQSPETACWPVCMWPAEDQRRWLASLEEGDLLDGVGSRAHHRGVSNDKVRKGYGRWINYLNRHGLVGDLGPCERITPKIVDAYVRELFACGNASQTVMDRLQELHDAAMVMDGDRDWHWIRDIESRVRRVHRPKRDKWERMASAVDLENLARELMAEAPNRSTKRLRAIQFRDGLLLAFFARRPLRRANVAQIGLGRELVDLGSKWIVRIDGEETKTGTTLSFFWPRSLMPALEEYLRVWRPILCDGRGRWYRPSRNSLWVSSHGSPLTAQAIYNRICKVTKAKFGFAISPHFIRDVVATTQAVAQPSNRGLASVLLGHRNSQTTDRHYVHARSLEASGQYQNVICGLRRDDS